jgi:hypothetical protein
MSGAVSVQMLAATAASSGKLVQQTVGAAAAFPDGGRKLFALAVAYGDRCGRQQLCRMHALQVPASLSMLQMSALVLALSKASFVVSRSSRSPQQ